MKSLKTIAFLLVISSVCALILGGTELMFQRASHLFDVRLYVSILDLFGIDAEEENAETLFSSSFETRLMSGNTYYIHKDSGAVAFSAAGSGLWSRIELLLAFYPGFERMYGLKVLSQAETPGLGGRIAEPAFQERFRDVDAVPDIRIVKFASASNQVDAVTGASKTSDAVAVIINQGLTQARKAFGL